MDLDSLVEIYESNKSYKPLEAGNISCAETEKASTNTKNISQTEIEKTSSAEKIVAPTVDSEISGSHEVKYIRDRMHKPSEIKDKLEAFKSLKNEQFMTKDGRNCLDTEEKILINLINQKANKGTFVLRLGQFFSFIFGLPITILAVLMIAGSGFNIVSIITGIIGLALLGNIGELGDKIKDINEAINAQRGVGKVKIVNNHIIFN